MEKEIKNANAIARKLRPASTKANNNKLEVVREKKQIKEEKKKGGK